MDRGKIIAVLTGVISIIIAIAYLVLVQIMDFRGEMQPAPLSVISYQLPVNSYQLPVNRNE